MLMENATSSTPLRRSRFRRQAGSKTVAVSPRDLAIFRLLDRYRYLPSNFLHAFVGGNPIRFKQRLGDLFHEGYLDRPARQWQVVNARYRPAIYELDRRAADVLDAHRLRSRQRVGAGNNFLHEVMVCLVTASFELAARPVPGMTFRSWTDLLADMPALADDEPSPFAIPVSITRHERRIAFDLKPDGRPFALELALPDGRRRSLYFPGLEVDRHTEPLAATDLDRSSIAKKILAYREMVATELYKTRLGFSNMLVPIVTVNARHMDNMIRLVLDLTHGRGASYLLFKTLPDLQSFDATVVPDAAILAEPWQRAGHPPFAILDAMRAA